MVEPFVSFALEISPSAHCLYDVVVDILDARVKIWLNDLSEIQQCQTEGELLLTTLHYHSKSINTVRFSPTGRMLASGSDDHYVVVCAMRERAPDGPSGEHWNKQFTCHGHSMDVLDVAWCPNETTLASCSIDNTVMVWSLKDGQSGVIHPAHVLQAHEGFVKVQACCFFAAVDFDDSKNGLWGADFVVTLDVIV